MLYSSQGNDILPIRRAAGCESPLVHRDMHLSATDIASPLLLNGDIGWHFTVAL